jgi:hypothetical protein
VVKRDETIPPASGEVDMPVRVVLLSRRARLVGDGDVIAASDVADLLMALDDKRRVAVVVDTHYCTIDVGFFVRIARDFPTSVSICVLGDAHADRRIFHEHGIFRAQFEPDTALLSAEEAEAPMDRGAVMNRVRTMLARQPTPLEMLKKK